MFSETSKTAYKISQHLINAALQLAERFIANLWQTIPKAYWCNMADKNTAKIWLENCWIIAMYDQDIDSFIRQPHTKVYNSEWGPDYRVFHYSEPARF